MSTQGSQFLRNTRFLLLHSLSAGDANLKAQHRRSLIGAALEQPAISRYIEHTAIVWLGSKNHIGRPDHALGDTRQQLAPPMACTRTTVLKVWVVV
jgi:hypothetical protein